MSQIALPLAAGGKGPARIVVGNANAHVAEALLSPETWPYRTAVLTGPPRSGKSLLARWFSKSGKGDAIDDGQAMPEDALFHRWNRAQEQGTPLLIVGGAGGVGSAAIQLARQLTGLTVIATASRAETEDWVTALGAHHVINHTRPLAPQLARAGFPSVDIVAAFAGTRARAGEFPEIIADEGHIGMIEGDGPLDFGAREYGLLFQKAASLHFELMFVRARPGAANMIRQHEILSEVSRLVDAGILKTTMTRRLSPIRAATLREAHAAVESGRMIGKIVVAGWPDDGTA